MGDAPRKPDLTAEQEKARVVRDPHGGFYIETPPRMWAGWLDRWRAAYKADPATAVPSPLPRGHIVFGTRARVFPEAPEA